MKTPQEDFLQLPLFLNIVCTKFTELQSSVFRPFLPVYHTLFPNAFSYLSRMVVYVHVSPFLSYDLSNESCEIIPEIRNAMNINIQDNITFIVSFHKIQYSKDESGDSLCFSHCQKIPDQSQQSY